MIPFAVVVLDELVQCDPVALPHQNHPVEALVFDRSTKRSAGTLQFGARNDVCTTYTILQHFAQRRAPLPVAVSDDHPAAGQGCLIGDRYCAGSWRLKASSGCDVQPTICTRRVARSSRSASRTLPTRATSHTSVVKKSVPTIPPQYARVTCTTRLVARVPAECPALSGSGAIVDRAKRCPMRLDRLRETGGRLNA